MNKKLTAFFTKKFPAFLTTNLGILVLGFVLTTVCGSFINWLHTNATSARDKKFELFKGQVAKHEVLLTDLSNAMGARVFRLHRVLWNLDDPYLDPPGEMWRLDENARNEIEDKKRWDDYYKTVVDWNLSYRDYKRRIRLLAGDELANEFFMAGEQGAVTAKEGSLLAAFESLHTKVKRLHEEARKSGTVNRAKHDEAEAAINRLYDRIDDYMARLSNDFEAQDKSGNPLDQGRSKN
jgi:hypothetical protein